MRTTSPYLLERLAGGALRTAHGGASRLAPDNTLEAILAAAGAEVDYIEIDVHRTRDGYLLLWHDEVFVTPDGVYEIAQITLAEAHALNLPDGTLATLPEAVEAAQGRTGLMIDMKAPDLHEPIADVLRAARFTDAMVCGGYDETLERVKALLPDIAVSRTPDAAYHRDLAHRLAAEPYLDAVTVYWRTVGPELIQVARAAGVLVLAWTVDYPHLAERILLAGAHGVTSNDLGVLAGLRSRA